MEGGGGLGMHVRDASVPREAAPPQLAKVSEETEERVARVFGNSGSVSTRYRFASTGVATTCGGEGRNPSHGRMRRPRSMCCARSRFTVVLLLSTVLGVVHVLDK